jgi:hypothetical protein
MARSDGDECLGLVRPELGMDFVYLPAIQMSSNSVALIPLRFWSRVHTSGRPSGVMPSGYARANASCSTLCQLVILRAAADCGF